MKKLLILCVLLLAALLSGCAAEPLQGQTTGNTPKAPTPQEETPASFEPVSTEPNAPTVAVDPADSMPNEDKHESGPAIDEGKIKYECKRCGTVAVRVQKGRRHDKIDLYAPEGQVRYY